MSSEKLIRITSCIHRKEGVSKEDFYKYWTQVHGPMATDFMKRHGVVEIHPGKWHTATLKYNKNLFEQYHATDETKSLGNAMAAAAGREMLSYDGLTDAYVHDFKTFEDAFKDPEYLEKIRPNELAFIDVDSLQMTIEYNYKVLRGGERVKEHARTFPMREKDLMAES